MKKLLALMIVMSVAVVANADMLVTKILLDGQGNLNTAYSGSPTIANSNNNVSAALGLGAEYLANLRSNTDFMLGAGLQYLFPRTLIVANTSPQAAYCPIYVTGVYTIKKMEKMSCFVKANLGYNISYTGNNDMVNNSTLAGGLYYAFGIGTRCWKDKIITELMYSVYQGTHTGIASISGLNSTDTYSNFGLRVGYAFDLGCYCLK